MTVRSAAAAAIASGLLLAGCGGDEDETSSAGATEAAPPAAGTAPPGSPSRLPPEFVECMADEGFEVDSGADIHSAPPAVLQKCFGALHAGGAGP